MLYSELQCSEAIHKAVERMGFAEMTEVQEKTIPVMLAGRDVIAKAPTGTGKTMAFGIPIIERIDPESEAVQAVVLAPTRELAMQITDEMRDIAVCHEGVRLVCLYGGQPIGKQIDALKRRPQIVVATPGRLSDHMKRRTVTLKDVIGRTVHWCVFDGGTQLGGAMWFIQALFQVSILYALVEFILQRLLHGADTLLPQGLFSGVLLWLGWRCGLAGWNMWGLGIAASCYCLFYLGTVLRRTTRESIPAYQRGIFAAAAFAVLLILGRLGSVGLAGNGYSSPIFLLVTSLAGWVLVREAACLTAHLPCVRAALAYLGRATMPIVILHFLSFKLVTWLGLLATGGEPYLLAAFPIYFTGGAWWLAYTAAGLVLPLAANAVYKKIKNTVLAH